MRHRICTQAPTKPLQKWTAKSPTEIKAEGVRMRAIRNADTTNHGDGTDAYTLLRTAEQLAAPTHKRILLLFHATWCVGCFGVHVFLHDPKVRTVLDRYFVIREIDTGERTKGWANPHADDLCWRYGPVVGIPYEAITDASGHLIGASVQNGCDFSAPSDPVSVRLFLAMLKKAAPSMSDAKIEVLRLGIERAYG